MNHNLLAKNYAFNLQACRRKKRKLGVYLLSEPDRYSAITASFSLKSISYSEFGLSPATESLDFFPSAKSFLSFANSD